MGGRLRFALLFGLVLLADSVVAASQGKPSLRIDYAGQMVLHSENAKRIEASDEAPAQALLSEARELYQQARSAQAAGKMERAEALGGEALRRFTLAVQALPRATTIDAERRKRYGDLSREILDYLEWYDSAPYISREDDRVVTRLKEEMQRAEQLASEGNHIEANGVLNQVLAEVVELSNRTLTSSTVISSLDFATPEEEYQYEMARNDDYKRLIPLAIEQKSPNQARLNMMERFIAESEVLLKEAEEAFLASRFEEAIRSMQASTDQLTRALAILGVR